MAFGCFSLPPAIFAQQLLEPDLATDNIDPVVSEVVPDAKRVQPAVRDGSIATVLGPATAGQ